MPPDTSSQRGNAPAAADRFQQQSSSPPPALHTLLVHVAADQPAQATITPLDYDAARGRGITILKRHRAHRTFERLPGASKTVLFAMADFFGVVREHCAGLIVDVTIEDLAASIGVEWRTLYRPLRVLESVGCIRRIKRGGPYRDAFELVMPPEPDDELLDGLSVASRLRDASHQANGLADDDLARATREASRRRDASDPNTESVARATRDASLTSELLARATRDAGDPNTESLARATREASRLARAFDDPARATRYASSSSDEADPDYPAAIDDARATRDAAPHAIANAIAISAIATLQGTGGGSCKDEIELRSLRTALMQLGFDPKHATSIAKHPNCTREQILVAYQRAEWQEKNGGFTRGRLSYLRAAIERKWAPPPSAEELAMRGVPPHQQDDAGVDRMRGAEAAARQRRIKAKLDELSDEQVAALMKELVDGSANDFQRTAYSRIAATNPRGCGSLQDLVYSRYCAGGAAS